MGLALLSPVIAVAQPLLAPTGPAAPDAAAQAELRRRAGRALDAANQIGREGANVPEINSILSRDAVGIGGERAAIAAERGQFERSAAIVRREAVRTLNALEALAPNRSAADQARAAETLAQVVRSGISAGALPPAAVSLSSSGQLAASLRHPAVVMLRHRDGGVCSGSYIGNGWVLTAAHCVCDVNTYPTGDLCRNQANPGLDRTKWRVHFRHAGSFNVSEVRFSSAFAWSSLAQDVALMRLRNAPNWITPLSLTGDAATVSLVTAQIAGFGYAGGSNVEITAASPGLATETPMQTRSCTSTDAGYLKPEAHLCHRFEVQAGGMLCQGDSGGPLLMLASTPMSQMAIASGHDQRTGTPINPALLATCGATNSIGLHTRTTLPAVTAFIAATLASSPAVTPVAGAFPAIGLPPDEALLLSRNGDVLVAAGTANGYQEFPLEQRPSSPTAPILVSANAEGQLVGVRLLARRPGRPDEVLCENRDGWSGAMHCTTSGPVPQGARLVAGVTGLPRSPSGFGLPALANQPTRMQLLVLELPAGNNAN